MYVNERNKKETWVYTKDDYEDEPYEMIQDGPYEAEKYPSVDDISPNAINDTMGYRKREPKSPSFNTQENQSFNANSAQKEYNTPKYGQSDNSNTNSNGNINPDFQKQLMSKIRKQAEQLVSLENYKILCEKRIKEIAGSHPLPIEPQHIGNQDFINKQVTDLQRLLKSKDDELSQLQSELRSNTQRKSFGSSYEYGKDASFSSPQALSHHQHGQEELAQNYNNLYNKYKNLLTEKQTLEESLRNETYSNEEQRAYIDMLKQMVDDKFDKLALSKWLGGMPNKERIDVLLELRNAYDQKKESDREIENVRVKTSEYQNEVTRLAESLDKMSEKNQKLVDENIRVSQINIEYSQIIKDNEQEFRRIEEEKSNLIDFADERDQKLRQVSESYNQLNEGLEKLKEERQKALFEADQRFEELSKLKGKLQSLQDENDDLTMKLSQKEHLIANLDEERGALKGELGARPSVDRDRYERLKNDNNDLKAKADQYKNEMNNLETELRTYKEMYHDKEHDHQNRIYKMKVDYDKAVENLEKKNDELQKNETKLKETIQSLSQNHSHEISRFQHDKKVLEADLQEINKSKEVILKENEDFKRNINEMEKWRLESEDRIMTLSKELTKSREDFDFQNKKFTELNDTNMSLERRLQERDIELNSYDGFLNDSKERFKSEKQTHLDELKKLYDENSNLRQDVRHLREECNRVVSSLDLKEEEIAILRNHIEQKNHQNKVLMEELKGIREKYDDNATIRDQLSILRTEKNRNLKEVKEYEEIIEEKDQSLRDAIASLESANKEITELENKVKDIELEKEDVEQKYKKFQEHADEMADEQAILRVNLDEKQEKIGRLLKENDRQQRQLVEITNENQDLKQKVESATVFYDSNLDTAKKESDQVEIKKGMKYMEKEASSIKDALDNFVNITTISPQVIEYLGTKFKEMIQRDRDALTLSSNQLGEWIQDIAGFNIIIRNEVENLLRKCADYSQDLKIANQRIGTLEKKCYNLNIESGQIRQNEEDLRKEVSNLRMKHGYSKSITGKLGDDDEGQLKKEVTRLQGELEGLRNQNLVLTMKNNNRSLSPGGHSQEDTEGYYAMYKQMVKEKKAFEELIEKIYQLMASPEVRSLINQLLKNQDELAVADREKQKVQNELADLETEYKISMKRTPTKNITPEKSTSQRTVIEQKRNELNNINEQMEIFKKRKEILFDEIKSLQIVERKRYENSVELEKNLIETRTELKELKDQKHGLENMTHNLKDAVRSANNQRSLVDYENNKLRNYMRGEQENDRNYSNYNPMNYQKDTTNPTLQDDPETLEDDQQYINLRKTHDGSLSDRQGGGDAGGLARFGGTQQLPTGMMMTDKKSLLNARKLEPETYSQVKLKDRLNQARNILSSIKKTTQNDSNI